MCLYGLVCQIYFEKKLLFEVAYSGFSLLIIFYSLGPTGHYLEIYTIQTNSARIRYNSLSI